MPIEMLQPDQAIVPQMKGDIPNPMGEAMMGAMGKLLVQGTGQVIGSMMNNPRSAVMLGLSVLEMFLGPEIMGPSMIGSGMAGIGLNMLGNMGGFRGDAQE